MPTWAGCGCGATGATLWLTGLPAAGKTTLAYALEDRLMGIGAHARVLDGDELRVGLCRDLGFSRSDRARMIRRVTGLAVTHAEAGGIAIVALVSPYAEDRQSAREIHIRHGIRFIEVFVDTPLATCKERDPKGLYARSARGQLLGLTGIDDPYESPQRPDLRLPVQPLSTSVQATLAVLAKAAANGRTGPLRADRV